MLRTLTIRDVLLIDRLELAFRPGLNVLTGETGAGKSILLDALGMVLGWRGRADLVRAGAQRGEVEAVFLLAPDHPAHAVLAEAGLDGGSDLVLRRHNHPDGRKQAWVNDRRASGDLLRALSDTLVELHGQHDDRGLLDPGGHRALLDAFAGLEAERAACRAAWAALAAARRALTEAEASQEAAAREEEFLRHAAAEIASLAPEPGEEEALDSRRRLLQQAGRIGEQLARAGQAMGGQGAEGLLSDALRWLEDVAEVAEGRLAEVADGLGRALDELAEASRGLEAAMADLEGDPMALEAVEERLFAIRALARKHQIAPNGLADLGAEFDARLAAFEDGAARLAGLAAACNTAEATHRACADALTRARTEAAARLDVAMAAELPALKLERARFTTTIAPATPGPDGADAVAFEVATNPGAPAGPLARIASGGELSRFLLALKVCLAGGDEGKVMIFDEIDRGVGGATADAVGRRLARLAEGGQVLVVTHAPQVAARGAHHWRVAKEVAGEVTTTRVAALDPAAREDEIARMLSGADVTEAARAAARALLEG